MAKRFALYSSFRSIRSEQDSQRVQPAQLWCWYQPCPKNCKRITLNILGKSWWQLGLNLLLDYANLPKRVDRPTYTASSSKWKKSWQQNPLLYRVKRRVRRQFYFGNERCSYEWPDCAADTKHARYRLAGQSGATKPWGCCKTVIQYVCSWDKTKKPLSCKAYSR